MYGVSYLLPRACWIVFLILMLCWIVRTQNGFAYSNTKMGSQGYLNREAQGSRCDGQVFGSPASILLLPVQRTCYLTTRCSSDPLAVAADHYVFMTVAWPICMFEAIISYRTPLYRMPHR